VFQGDTVLFPAWETFYVIVGSSAGALTGLMFVVIALVADISGSKRTIDAFGTPTVVHFSAILLLSAILTAPWPTVSALRVALELFASAGAVYAVLVVWRARGQSDYQPVFEDWLFHAALPLVAYVSVLAAAVLLPRYAMFVIAGAAVLLLFIGIHNAWDTVTYVVVKRWEARTDTNQEK
jgi:hypothetical protein